MADAQPPLSANAAPPPLAVPLSDEDCALVREQLARAVRRVCPPELRAQADDVVQTAVPPRPGNPEAG